MCATKNVDELAGVIYDFIKSCGVEGLGVEECDQVENFMNILLSKLQLSEVKVSVSVEMMDDLPQVSSDTVTSQNEYELRKKFEQLFTGSRFDIRTY